VEIIGEEKSMNDGKKVGIPFECILSASAENLSAWEVNLRLKIASDSGTKAKL